MLNGLSRYRGFITDSIKRDFQSRYQSSFLGVLWLVLQPVAMIVVYTVIFSEIMRSRLAGMSGPFSYSIYLCSGVLTWGLFTETLNGLVNVFIANANILKKLSFPRICLPVIVASSAFINFLIIFTLFIIFLLLIDSFPGWSLLKVLPILAIQMLFTIGLGIILGVMNVFVRDVGQFVSIVIQFWFWLTPIVYVGKILPTWVQEIQAYNPMAIIVMGYQNIFVYHTDPDWKSLSAVFSVAMLLVILGWTMFRKHVADIVDEL
ncbi:ABC transporter permease [Pantoea sp. B65]|uniref:ABC transporter permease n=1 Tax=Pantoea sp. B65 TaxID=2813359 RepID=UPI0039B4E152